MDATTIGILRQFGDVASRRIRVDVPQAMVNAIRAVAVPKLPLVDGKRQLSPEDVNDYEALCNRLLSAPLSAELVAEMAEALYPPTPPDEIPF